MHVSGVDPAFTVENCMKQLANELKALNHEVTVLENALRASEADYRRAEDRIAELEDELKRRDDMEQAYSAHLFDEDILDGSEEAGTPIDDLYDEPADEPDADEPRKAA